MPKVPDASSVTRLRALSSASVPDPTKRSASFVPSQTSLLSSLRTTTQGQGVSPGRSLLSTSVTRGYVNPRHQGVVTGGTPVNSSITIDGGGFNFVSLVTQPTFTYEFPLTGGTIPASTFTVRLTNFTNLSSLKFVRLADYASPSRELLGPVTISIAPEWAYSSFTSDVTTPELTSLADEVFPTTAVLTFRNVPVVFGVNLVLLGLVPPAEAP